MGLTAVILGSYRKHFDQISLARDRLIQSGIEVVLPVGEVVDDSAEFVSLSSDEAGLTPGNIEAAAVDKALEASFVYFVCPDGYIGRTASYELGRLTQAGKQPYFSHMPSDLPVAIPKQAILSVDALIAGLKDGTINP